MSPLFIFYIGIAAIILSVIILFAVLLYWRFVLCVVIVAWFVAGSSGAFQGLFIAAALSCLFFAIEFFIGAIEQNAKSKAAK
jgi:hypothetical protein